MTFAQTIGASLISSFLTAIVFGSIGLYFAAWLAFKRYKLEKWWDRKASAYEAILGNLFDYMFFFEKLLEGHLTDREPTADVKRDLQNKSEEAHRNLRKTTKIGSFIISDKAANILVRLERDIDAAIETQNWYDFIEGNYEASLAALNQLRDEARNDLSLEPAMPLALMKDKVRVRVRNRPGHPDLGAPEEP